MEGKRAPIEANMRPWITNFLHFRKPLICAVNGLAVGGGANLAIFLMDLVYASKD